MAEALVSVLVERLASMSLQQVDQELKMVIGVDKEIDNLTRTLKSIRAVLDDAEQRQVMEESVKTWLSDLKEVSDEIGDLLDEWSYETLKRQIAREREEEKKSVGSAPVAKKKLKVCSSIPSPCCCSDGVNSVVRRHEIAKKIKDLSERLTSIDAKGKTYQFLSPGRSPEQRLIKHQKTSSLLDISFGRDYEKEFLKCKLLDNQGGEKEGDPVIIPIVGMGGVGKTNLSQLVYNDEKVEAHFDKRIWICVSDPFEEVQIMAAIAQGLDIVNHPLSNPLQTYSKYVVDSLGEKEGGGRKIKEKSKFLLVLDDVWNPTESKWEEVIKPLRAGAKGSKILVTTRIEKVAATMGAVPTNVIRLGMLSEEHCRELFRHATCISRDKGLSGMMLEVVRKCKGLPLAVKTLGSLMRGEKSLGKWEDIMNNKEFKQNVFRPLLLSYYDLAPTIRRCLLYCAIFPKDYQIDKLNLIQLWMSQDYLSMEKHTKAICKVGEDYFDDLVMRSFFQDFRKDFKGNIKSCKMHDIVHEFLRYLTNNEFCFLDAELFDKELYIADARLPVKSHSVWAIPDVKVRHIFLTSKQNTVQLPSGKGNWRTVATVILDCNRWVFGVESLLQLKSLKTLDLSRFWGFIPDGIGRLIHLRYFKLTDNPSKELPETLSDLYHLQTLIVTCCDSLGTLPNGMEKLINLKHLDVRDCKSLDVTHASSLEEKLPGLRTYYTVYTTTKRKDSSEMDEATTADCAQNYPLDQLLNSLSSRSSFFDPLPFSDNSTLKLETDHVVRVAEDLEDK